VKRSKGLKNKKEEISLIRSGDRSALRMGCHHGYSWHEDMALLKGNHSLG
jgi:hypothetical protein